MSTDPRAPGAAERATPHTDALAHRSYLTALASTGPTEILFTRLHPERRLDFIDPLLESADQTLAARIAAIHAMADDHFTSGEVEVARRLQSLATTIETELRRHPLPRKLAS